MKKETLIIHTNAWPILKGLSTEQLGRLFWALIAYQRDEPLPKLNDVTKMAFDFMAAQLDRDNDKYAQIVEKRREAGRKSAAMRNKSQQPLTSVNHNDNDNVNDNDNDNENDNERYVSLAASPSLSLLPGTEEELREVYGERADALIEDVKAYYSAHPAKAFPGWPVAMAQFDRNQKRWGKAEKQASSHDLAELLGQAFGEVK